MGRKGHIVMKKSLWGYNVQEVEDTLELMESQQAAQVQKNQHLESELKQLREKLAVLQQEKEAGRLFVGRAEDDPQVQARLEALTREKEEWKARAESLSARLTRPENGGDMEQVSEICRLAYNDMSEAKKNVRRRLEEYVEDFLCEWRTGQEKVNRLMQDIDGVRDQAKAFTPSREPTAVMATSSSTGTASRMGLTIRERVPFGPTSSDNQKP